MMFRTYYSYVVVTMMSFFLGTVSFSTASYVPTEGNLKAREWFQDAKFGLFIHWGIYSVLGHGEWVMHNENIPVSDYEKLAPEFNPILFDPAEWVSLAKAAGMKYITITSKHHDGCALFDSAASDWNFVARTPFKKDILKLLADECRKQDIKLFFYYSQLDWHHQDYFPQGTTGHSSGRPAHGIWSHYLDFMNAQLTELLSNYGDVAGIWFDGWWDKPDANWDLKTTYDLIHKLQSHALVGSNHHKKPFDGEDFQMIEKDLPGENTSGFSRDFEMGTLPLETCETINQSWGYDTRDHNYKSVHELIHYLVRAAGHGANFLLNVGPMSDGRIDPESVQRLLAVGKWLQKNGETIYGTRKGPVGPQFWGVMTRKGNSIFVHVLMLASPFSLFIPLHEKIRNVTYFDDGSSVKHTLVSDGVILDSERINSDEEYDTIIEIKLADVSGVCAEACVQGN